MRDFSLIFDALTTFEESLLAARMEADEEPEAPEAADTDDDGADFLLKDPGSDVDLRCGPPCLGARTSCEMALLSCTGCWSSCYALDRSCSACWACCGGCHGNLLLVLPSRVCAKEKCKGSMPRSNGKGGNFSLRLSA